MSKSKSKAKKEYIALTNVTNGKTGVNFEAGDTVKDGDFTAAVIKNWLEIEPPVLEVKS